MDAMIVAGVRQKIIAERFGISPRAQRRHASTHLASSMAMARNAHAASSADDLLAHLQRLGVEATAVLERAKANENDELVLRAIARIERQLEIAGKIAGAIAADGTTTVNTGDRALSVTVLAALHAFPEAREALALALGTGDES